jgi:glycosyltransferase involved in cell wall biosynthesis
VTAPRSITAVLPAYNEAAVIADVVTRTAQALEKAGLEDYEVLVVDDGSADATAAQAESVGARQHVRVIRHRSNRGYGGALRTGFENATSEAVWLMDSDGQFDPDDIARMLPLYAQDRMVAGYRAERRDSLVRRFYHWAFFQLVHLLFGPTVVDVNCAFKLFPREVGIGLTAKGAMISTELVLRARRSGYRIAEVAIPHYPRTAGVATGANWRVVVRAFAELYRLRRHPEALRNLAAPAPPG